MQSRVLGHVFFAMAAHLSRNESSNFAHKISFFLTLGDRFWFENGGFVSSFTPSQLKEVRKVTLARILCDNLDDLDRIHPNLMRPPTDEGRSANYFRRLSLRLVFFANS